MPPAVLNAAAVVEIWERGRPEHIVDRALTILAVLEQRPRRELAQLSLERRDQLLLAWRGRLFSGAMAGYATCPACECGVDVTLTPTGSPQAAAEEFVLEVGGTTVAVRMPTSLDLAEALASPTVAAAHRVLLRRCLAADLAEHADGGLDDAVLAAVDAELDRRADISALAASLDCPECGFHWTLEVDVASYLWREIEILAVRMLRDVDVLARRYGWSEREILALSTARRQYYLELAS